MKPKLSQMQLAMLVAGLLSSGPGAVAADLVVRSPMVVEPAAGSEAPRPVEAKVPSPAGAGAGLAAEAGVDHAPEPQPAASGHYINRVRIHYGDLLGARGNLESLVAGLRHGTPIVLTGPGASVSFTSPAGRMGYGDITQTLNLLAKQLAAVGLDRPTPGELQAVLVGGEAGTALPGILRLRAQGWGWARIARNLGTRPETQAASGSGIALPAGLRREEPGLERVRLSFAPRGLGLAPDKAWGLKP